MPIILLSLGVVSLVFREYLTFMVILSLTYLLFRGITECHHQRLSPNFSHPSYHRRGAHVTVGYVNSMPCSVNSYLPTSLSLTKLALREQNQKLVRIVSIQVIVSCREAVMWHFATSDTPPISKRHSNAGRATPRERLQPCYSAHSAHSSILTHTSRFLSFFPKKKEGLKA